jgi:hypothetical protein
MGLSDDRLRDAFVERFDRLLALERAIVEHRTAIQNAGTVKVQPGYEKVAEAKHRIDERLWSVLDA